MCVDHLLVVGGRGKTLAIRAHVVENLCVDLLQVAGGRGKTIVIRAHVVENMCVDLPEVGPVGASEVDERAGVHVMLMMNRAGIEVPRSRSFAGPFAP